MSQMAPDNTRTADLVEIHQLCARYMAFTSQFVEDRWLEVFTPDAQMGDVLGDLEAERHVERTHPAGHGAGLVLRQSDDVERIDREAARPRPGG